MIPALLLTLLLLMTACGGTSDDSSSATGASAESEGGESASFDSEEADAMQSEDGAFDLATDQGAGGEAAERASTAPVEPASFQDGDAETDPEADTPAEVEAVVRTIIRRANVHLQVEDVLSSSAEAVTLIESYGGFVFGQETSTDGAGRSSITFKVPPEDFQDILEDLSTIGFLRDQTVTADDVTGKVVDLKSRIQTAETSVGRLRSFLAEASDLEKIIELEGSLLQRESDLEVLRGQLRTIQSQAALSTITVVLTERVPGPELEVDVTVYAGHDEGGTCDGDDELSVDEDDFVTLCYRLTNVGDTHLGEFTIRDSSLRLDQEDFLEVKEGSLDEALAPGDYLTLYVQIEANPKRQSVLGQVGASATDELGNLLNIEGVSGRDDLRLDVASDESPPTFMDGLRGSWKVLVLLALVAAAVAGAILPFIWLAPVGYFLRRWSNGRKKRLPSKSSIQPGTVGWNAAGQPVPPAPQAAPAPPAAPQTGTVPHSSQVAPPTVPAPKAQPQQVVPPTLREETPPVSNPDQ